MDTTQPIITRAEARALGLPRYFTGKPCVNGHVEERDTWRKKCPVCDRDRKRAAERIENMTAEQIERRRERKCRANMTPERLPRVRELDREWPRGKRRADQLTPEQLERARVYACDWRKRDSALHPEKWAAYRRDAGAKRKAAELQATPAWADMGAIRAIYVEAVRLQVETGIVHHVDHIVPLVGKARIDGKLVHIVCGLHVENNLRPLPGAENVKKNCRHWPDMP